MRSLSLPLPYEDLARRQLPLNQEEEIFARPINVPATGSRTSQPPELGDTK